MFTTGFKFFFGFGILLVVAGVVYAWTSGGVDWDLFPGALGDLYFAMLGALSLGYRGAIGDHLGYTVLMGGAGAAFTLGGFMIAFRDADSKAIAEVAGTPKAPAQRAPSTPNYWSPLSGLGLGLVALGLATNRWLCLAGFVLIALMAFEWMVAAWADRATGDPELNVALRNRILNPLELPIVGILAVGFVAVGVSRVLLAVTAFSAIWIFIGFAAAIFLVGVVLSVLPSVDRRVLVGAVVVGAVLVLVGGVIGAAAGERDFHHEEDGAEHVEEGAGSDAATNPGASGHDTEGSAESEGE